MTEWNKMTEKELIENIKGFKNLIKVSNKKIADYKKIIEKFYDKEHIVKMMKHAIVVELERQDEFYKFQIENSSKALEKFGN